MKEIVKFIIKKYGVGNLWYVVIIYGFDVKVILSFGRIFLFLENWLIMVDGMWNEVGNLVLENVL